MECGQQGQGQSAQNAVVDMAFERTRHRFRLERRLRGDRLYPVAVVIFSGLITSTLLDSFLTPAMVKLFGRKPIENLVAVSGSEAY